MAKTLKDFQNLVTACKYKPGWYFICQEDGKGIFFQIGVTAAANISIDPFTGERSPWKGAKHYMSEHMCDTEVVGVVFGAIKQAEEHETREWFRFMNKPVFNPHISIYAQVAIAGKLANLDMRENAMSMEEETK
jgi:hypothetical protein